MRKRKTAEKKLSALRTDDCFRERAAHGSLAKAKRILKRVGRERPPSRVTRSSERLS